MRIFTPVQELPFAGHPTLGTCHAWLDCGHSSSDETRIVQECERRARADPAHRGWAGVRGPAAAPVGAGRREELLAHIASILNIERGAIVAAEWADNGPGWVAVMLESAEAVLAVRPGFVDLEVGIVGPYGGGAPEAFELRAFFPKDGATVEDPVTGSLNASVAQWLVRTGRATAPYVAGQGAALGRAGRIHISADPDGQIWVGGGTVTCVRGEVEL